jgi:hypothetical protein
MTAKELNDSVCFIVDKDNHATAVVVPSDLWHTIIHALEENGAHEFEILLQAQGPARIDVTSLLMPSFDEDLG